jgi:hypothetical protein
MTAAAPRKSRRAKMSIVSDNDMKEAAAVPVPIEEPATVPALSPHIDHASAHYGKAQIEARGYELGIAVLEAELRGITEKGDADVTRIETDVEEEVAEISDRARRRVARIREDLVTAAASLNRRITDLKETRHMLIAQIEQYRAMHPEKQEADNAETNAESGGDRTGEEGGADRHAGEQTAGRDTAR